MGHRVSWRAGTTKKPGDTPAPQALSHAGEQALQEDEEQQHQSQEKSNDARENQNTGTANVYLPIYIYEDQVCWKLINYTF